MSGKGKLIRNIFEWGKGLFTSKTAVKEAKEAAEKLLEANAKKESLKLAQTSTKKGIKEFVKEVKDHGKEVKDLQKQLTGKTGKARQAILDKITDAQREAKDHLLSPFAKIKDLGKNIKGGWDNFRAPKRQLNTLKKGAKELVRDQEKVVNGLKKSTGAKNAKKLATETAKLKQMKKDLAKSLHNYKVDNRIGFVPKTISDAKNIVAPGVGFGPRVGSTLKLGAKVAVAGAAVWAAGTSIGDRQERDVMNRGHDGENLLNAKEGNKELQSPLEEARARREAADAKEQQEQSQTPEEPLPEVKVTEFTKDNADLFAQRDIAPEKLAVLIQDYKTNVTPLPQEALVGGDGTVYAAGSAGARMREAFIKANNLEHLLNNPAALNAKIADLKATDGANAWNRTAKLMDMRQDPKIAQIAANVKSSYVGESPDIDQAKLAVRKMAEQNLPQVDFNGGKDVFAPGDAPINGGRASNPIYTPEGPAAGAPNNGMPPVITPGAPVGGSDLSFPS